MIEQLQENQKAIASGLEDIMLFNQLPDETTKSETTKLPIAYKPAMMSSLYKSDLDKGFHQNEIDFLTENKLSSPSQLLQDHFFTKGVSTKKLKLEF